MKLKKSVLPDYFTIASPLNSHYKVESNTFDFTDRNSDVLVVTCGDSWTWGAFLSENDDEEFRLTYTFGNLVSTELNADWLNLGQSGSNNFFIAEQVEAFSKIVPQLDYKKIYLICTFTEIGRSFDSHHDGYIDYISWFDNNIKVESDFDKFLYFLNAECLSRIKRAIENYNIEFRVGTNFVDAIGIESDSGFLKMPWFRLLNIDRPVVHLGPTGALRLNCVQQFIPEHKKSLFKSWFIKLTDATDRVNGGYHPTVEGHKIWANYVLESLC
jgi:hypothetical protein